MHGHVAQHFGALDDCALGEDGDDVVGARALQFAVHHGVVEIAGGAQIGLHESGRDLLALLREIARKHDRRGLGVRIEGVVAGQHHGGAEALDVCRGGLCRDRAVDGAVLERRRMLGEAKIDLLDIVVFQTNALHGLVEHGGVAAACAGDGHLAALHVGERLHLAAVNQLLAHQKGLKGRALHIGGLVGDELDGDAALHRVVEACGGRAAAHIELARAHGRDHLGARVEFDEIGLHAFSLEVALVLRDEERAIAHRIDDADGDLVGGARRHAHQCEYSSAERAA